MAQLHYKDIAFEIDDSDVAMFNGCSFCLRGDKYIAVYKPANEDSPKIYEYLHRMILQPGPRQEVDHIDGDIYNNKRDNLRIASRGQQTQNSCNWGRWPKGVSMDRRWGNFLARIHVNGQRKFLGSYWSLEDAVNAYNEAALHYYGPDAALSSMEGYDRKAPV